MRFFIAFFVAFSAVAAEDLPNLGIIGGRYAVLGQLPYQVSLQVDGGHRCGGAIIAENIVITAAHCVDQVHTSQMTILAGTLSRIVGAAQLGISRVSIHSQYNATSHAYDAAILFLQGSFQFDANVNAVQLPAEGEVLSSNAVGTVSGWGSVYFQSGASNILRYVTIPVWSRDQCLQNVPRLPLSHICAGDATGQKNSCPGDSGGPLVSNNKLIGIVSYGFGCGAYGEPSMYTYVAGIRAWIRQVTQL